MRVFIKPCKHCGVEKPLHYPFQCNKNPDKLPLRKVGKAYRNWKKFRKDYLEIHPPNFEGYYECYLCHKWIYPQDTTLDHIIPRSNRPDLAYNEDNLEFCCFPCNTKKGSSSLENYKKLTEQNVSGTLDVQLNERIME